MELITGSVALARRLEATDALAARLAAESQGRLRPATGAVVLEIAGGVAAFAGVGSPLTHAIGIGMHGPVTATDLDRIEDLYRDRGSPINIDLCPLADPALTDLLGRRGYRCIEFSNILVRRVSPPIEFHDPRIQRAGADEVGEWSRTLARGFFEHEPTAEELEIGFTLLHVHGAKGFLAGVDGVRAAVGALVILDGMAMLFADATLPAYRGRGLQSAIIVARLAEAAANGADMAMAATQPGSVSLRNYERCGFRVAYTKMNMQRD